MEIGPKGIRVVTPELSDVDARLVRQHRGMLWRWAMASWVEGQVGFPVEVAEWDGCVLPDTDNGGWLSGRRRRSVYQVVPSDLGGSQPRSRGILGP